MKPLYITVLPNAARLLKYSVHFIPGFYRCVRGQRNRVPFGHPSSGFDPGNAGGSSGDHLAGYDTVAQDEDERSFTVAAQNLLR
jgi:hypothetical protein